MEEQLELFGKVTVKSLQPIYTIKDNVEANSIELLKMEENDFDLIVGKSLYYIGQELIYIYPDTNLKEGNEYLESYINPTDKDGKQISSKLGAKNRVKAIGFNFHKGDFKKLYSNGIVCPINSNVEPYLCKIESESSENLKASGGKVFPSFLYKTDETNYKKLANSIEYPITLVGTMKSDGCLEKETMINTNKGIKTIGEICNSIDTNLLVQSFNFKTNQVEFNKLVDVKIQKNINNWYKITLENNTVLIVTNNHLIYLPEYSCYRKVEDLKIGNIVMM